MTWTGSYSEDWLSWYQDQVRKLVSLNIDLTNASSVADVDFKVAEMRKIANGIEREGARYVKEDLSAQFRDEYKKNQIVPGPIPRLARDAAYRDRKRMQTSIDENVRSVRNWVNNAGPAAKTTKAYNLLSKQNRELKTRMVAAKGKDLEGLQEDQRIVLERISQLPEFDHPQEPEIAYRAKRMKKYKNGQTVRKGDVVRQVRVSDHMAGVARRVDATTDNRAFLTSQGSSGNVMFLVSDGPGCGWAHHDDSQKAHGMVVTFDEAMGHLLAHEACRRSFSTFQKTRKKIAGDLAKKAGKSLREAKKAADRANSMKLSTLPKTAQAWAQYTSLAATLIGTSSAIRRNPGVRLFVMNIVNNPDELIPAWFKEVGQKFAGFRAMEQRLARTLGTDVLTLRSTVQAEVDNVFVSNSEAMWTDDVRVSKQTSQLLGVSQRTTKEDLYSAYHTFNDHVEFEAAKTAGLVGNLNDAILTAQLRQNMTDSGLAALDLHTIRGRVPRIPAQINATMRAVHQATTIDREFISRELVRGAAEMVHLPYTRANLANMRFSVGVGQEGRSRIATGIFDRLSKSDRWTASDISWAEKLGVELPSKVQLTSRDVVDALLPRITWNPGGLVSMGVELKRGFVVPFGRVYPPGTLRKFLNMEAHLSSAGVRQFSEDIREYLDTVGVHSLEGASKHFATSEGRSWMVKRLGLTIDSTTGIRKTGLVDDAITSINFFRNGPVMARFKFYGAKWEGFTVRALPDSEVFRLRYRYFKNWRGLESRAAFSQTDMVLLPTRRGGIRLSQIGDEAQLSLMKLHVYKGNLMGLHKVTGLSWPDLVAWEKATRTKYEGYMKLASSVNWQNIRSIDDLEAALAKLKLGSTNDSIVEVARGTTRLKAFDEQRALLDEIIASRFPNLPKMEYAIVPDANTPFDIAYNKEKRVIFVRQSLVDTWTEHGRLRRKMVGAGVFPPGTHDPIATLAHEAGHALYDQLPLARKKELWIKIGESDWPRTSGVWDYINERGVMETGRLERDTYYQLKREGRLVAQKNAESVDFPFQAIRNATNDREIGWAIDNWMGYDRNVSDRLSRQDRVVRTINSRISVAASAGPLEIIGELFSEYLTSASPRDMARILGDMLEVFYSRSLRSVR